MAEVPKDILLIIESYRDGTISPEDLIRLNEWYHSFNDTEIEVAINENESEQQLSDRIKNRLIRTIHHEHRMAVMPRRQWKIPAAAAMLILFSIGLYLMFLTGPAKHDIVTTTPLVNTETKLKNDIAPGGNKAILTLSDGSIVVLDSASKGMVSNQGNSKVEKVDNGLLAYTINNKHSMKNEEAYFNKIVTPRGGQYQVTLSDGTKVWLNAASSIYFPVVFQGSERKVELTGEAYFEVAKNKAKPFRVATYSSEIEVLGTHFNVNAYNDEAFVKTTLLEGMVKVSVPGLVKNSPVKFLLPGQQSDINKEGQISIINNADTEEAVSWMNGYFQFKNTDLKTILRQISRWYDVDIEYKGNVNLHFTGQLTKNENVSNVFEKLALTGEVHFKIEGRKIIVSQ
jgi:transmembrane sensor